MTDYDVYYESCIFSVISRLCDPGKQANFTPPPPIEI